MNRLAEKLNNNIRRKYRVRSRIHGTADKPRLSVFISNQHVSAQLIDDDKKITLLSVSTVGRKEPKGTMSEKAAWVGSEIGKNAKGKKISKVTFDRGNKLYHGRVKALAEEARKQGLEF
jgi:large subunit ribosomal protein L18